MKLFILLFTLLFSFSILADCCNSVELEDCKTELLKSDQCNDDSSVPESHEMCHCSFSCSPKILINQSYILSDISFSSRPGFPSYDEHFKNLNRPPVLQPPKA